MNAPASLSAAPGFTVERQRQVVAALRAVLPPACILFNEEDTRPYECDGLAAVTVHPATTARSS